MRTRSRIWGYFLLIFSLMLPASGFSDASSESAQLPESGYVNALNETSITIVSIGMTEISSYEQCKIALSGMSWYCDAKQESKDVLMVLGHPYFEDQKISIGWFDFNQDGNLDLISMSYPYECGANCPFDLAFADNSIITGRQREYRIFPVASAEHGNPSVVFDRVSGKVGLMFNHAKFVFWVDNLSNYKTYVKGK